MSYLWCKHNSHKRAKMNFKTKYKLYLLFVSGVTSIGCILWLFNSPHASKFLAFTVGYAIAKLIWDWITVK